MAESVEENDFGGFILSLMLFIFRVQSGHTFKPGKHVAIGNPFGRLYKMADLKVRRNLLLCQVILKVN